MVGLTPEKKKKGNTGEEGQHINGHSRCDMGESHAEVGAV